MGQSRGEDIKDKKKYIFERNLSEGLKMVCHLPFIQKKNLNDDHDRNINDMENVKTVLNNVCQKDLKYMKHYRVQSHIHYIIAVQRYEYFSKK